MGQIKVKAAAVLEARPEVVYATIADYREGHPNIIPKENMYDLQVEQGGYGTGGDTCLQQSLTVSDLDPIDKIHHQQTPGAQFRYHGGNIHISAVLQRRS